VSDVLDIDRLEALVSLASLIGILLLTPLFFSQRGDIKRLREFMESEPEHPGADIAASEQLLDRAEFDLERLYAERGEPVPGTEETVAATEVYPEGMKPEPGATPAGGVPAAARVTSERPALERVTMERSALEPHPHLRRFRDRITQPAWLAAISLGAVVIAIGAIVGSEQLLQNDEASTPAIAGLDPSQIVVAVLNGTDKDGLASDISTDVEAGGFTLGAVGNSEKPAEQSIVMFEKNRASAGRLVQRKLDIETLQPIDRQTQELAGGADVVVIVGEDRAK
jgi:hypothetical protein